MNIKKRTTTTGESVSISYKHGEADFSNLVYVVRCKECKYYTDKWALNTKMNGPKPKLLCLALARFFRENDFCSYGERKDG